MTSATLYDRLGGSLGIWVLVDDLLAAHRDNPVLGWRVRAWDAEAGRLEWIEQRLRQQVGAGTGGPERADPCGLAQAYREFDLTQLELAAAVDDLEAVLARYGLDDATRERVRDLTGS